MNMVGSAGRLKWHNNWGLTVTNIVPAGAMERGKEEPVPTPDRKNGSYRPLAVIGV
jgi:hypothetical protein